MRRFPILFVAANAALMVVPVPGASAETPRGEPEASCPEPEVTTDYDTTHFAVQATLLVSGCPARENSWVPLTVFISREDGRSGEGHGLVVMCGPFRSAADRDADEAPATYSCDVDMAVEHPPLRRPATTSR